MEILAFVGSGRKNGNTALIVDLIRQKVQQLALENGNELGFQTVFLHDAQLQDCIGCRICFDRGVENCPHQDGLLELRTKIQAADLLLLTTPVYVEDVSGMMKTFIDRMAYASHRPEFGMKMGYSVMTFGATATHHTLRTMSLAMRTWGMHIVGEAGFFGGGGTRIEELEVLHEKKIHRTAKELVKALFKKDYLNPDFISLMMFTVQQDSWRRATEHSLDLEFWQNRGWLEPGVTFYFPHQANLFKLTAARLVGKAICRFVG